MHGAWLKVLLVCLFSAFSSCQYTATYPEYDAAYPAYPDLVPTTTTNSFGYYDTTPANTCAICSLLSNNALGTSGSVQFPFGFGLDSFFDFGGRRNRNRNRYNGGYGNRYNSFSSNPWFIGAGTYQGSGYGQNGYYGSNGFGYYGGNRRYGNSYFPNRYNNQRGGSYSSRQQVASTNCFDVLM